jgi:hypothetical protein
MFSEKPEKKENNQIAYGRIKLGWMDWYANGCKSFRMCKSHCPWEIAFPAKTASC